MTIFIIFSSQKTRGRVAGNLARLHATHIARPSRGTWHRVLHSVAHIYLCAACLLRCSCTKKKALNYFENVNKDQNCDWLNLVFVQFSLENEDGLLYLTLFNPCLPKGGGYHPLKDYFPAS